MVQKVPMGISKNNKMITQYVIKKWACLFGFFFKGVGGE